MKNSYINTHNNMSRPGIVLLVTLVILSVLSILGYTLTSRVMAERLRNQYLIDYSKARYGCDSALKYALATMKDIDPVLISRPNEPDFSDLFAIDAVQYKEFIDLWKNDTETNDSKKNYFSTYDLFTRDTNDTNDMDTDNFQTVSVPGPYGAQWPLITEPVEIEIGTTKVKIEIEDENAKYPLGWAIVEDKDIQWELDAGFETFCEMSGLKYDQIEALKSDLSEINKLRNFKIHFEPVVTTTRERAKRTTSSRKSSSSKKSSSATQVRRSVITVATQISNQTTNFARLFNGSLLDKETLAKPTIIDGDRKESPLKYISTWGTRLININTAPRHILEAAFMFDGNQVEIADQVIQLRRVEPFDDIEDLQKRVVGYTDSIEKCKIYITTESNIFTIRITATSGMAKAFAVIAVKKDGSGIKRIAAINS